MHQLSINVLPDLITVTSLLSESKNVFDLIKNNNLILQFCALQSK